MKVSFEVIKSDPGSSFRTLLLNAPVSYHDWEYHFHPEIELVCVVQGPGTRHVGYHRGNYIDGDLVLIGSNVPHSGFGFNSPDPHNEIVLQFKENVIKPIEQIPEFRAVNKMLLDSRLGIKFSPKTKNIILPELRKILEAREGERYLQLLHVLLLLSTRDDFQYLNDKIMPQMFLQRNGRRLQEIFTYVEENYQRDISVKEISGITNLTVPAFCNFFKKATNYTFTEFVNRYRIDKACLDISQRRSITESCYESGFNSVSYFNRMFKRYVGLTPSEFQSKSLV